MIFYFIKVYRLIEMRSFLPTRAEQQQQQITTPKIIYSVVKMTLLFMLPCELH